MNITSDKFDQVRRILGMKRQIHRSYDAVFSTPEGSIVLGHIVKEGFVTHTTFVAGDPQQTTLNEGSRRLALSILRMARTNHKDVVRQIEQEMQNNGMNI